MRAVGVAQLVERLLPTSEIRGSNHNIGKFFRMNLSLHICQLQFRKDENKEKQARIGPFKKVRAIVSAQYRMPEYGCSTLANIIVYSWWLLLRFYYL